ncbi:MAG: hypothetical protein WEF86_00025 [Gemmatimonadota bacterium]
MIDTNFVSHYFRDMRNVTISLDEEVARWARIRAAQLDTSVSRLLGELLRESMQRETGYRSAMRQYLDRPPVQLQVEPIPYPTRDALHERTHLR